MRLATIARLLAPALALTGCGAALARTDGVASGTGTAKAATTVTASAPTGLPEGTAAEQTHPSVRPRVGHAHTHFVVRLTLASAAGHVGVVATSYLVRLGAPRGAIPSCSRPANVASIATGPAHVTLPVALGAPPSGWCLGRYRVTILLERGPYCPAPRPGQPPVPCPEFATQELDVGTTHFTVVRGR